MYRMACVNVSELLLQLLLRENPEWHSHPVAVVDRDKPQGRLLWVNRHARRHHILPGMTYAAALSLCDGLHARDVPPPDIERAVEVLARHLRRSPPSVECECSFSGVAGGAEPGVFWLNASGLDRLYESLTRWADSIRATIARFERFECAVVVGFTKFGTYAVSRMAVSPGKTTGNSSHRFVQVFEEPQAEEQAARAVPLEYLSLAASTRDTLIRLGVHTLGDFADLPPDGMTRRFGKSRDQIAIPP